MPARDVHHWIDRWERTGLLDDATAQLLHDDATRAGAAPQVQPDGIEAVVAVARHGVVEALGYVGAALTFGAVAVLFDVGEWSHPVLAAVLVVVGAVSVVGTVQLTPTTDPATGRLAGVLGAIAVAAVATAAWQLVAPIEGRAVTNTAGRELVVTVPALAVGIAVYLRHHHLLTHAALGASVAATCVALGDLLAGSSPADGTQQAITGLLLLGAAVAWAVACETGRLEPAWLGTPVAGAVAYVGAAMTTSWTVWSGTDHTAVLDHPRPRRRGDRAGDHDLSSAGHDRRDRGAAGHRADDVHRGAGLVGQRHGGGAAARRGGRDRLGRAVQPHAGRARLTVAGQPNTASASRSTSSASMVVGVSSTSSAPRSRTRASAARTAAGERRDATGSVCSAAGPRKFR